MADAADGFVEQIDPFEADQRRRERTPNPTDDGAGVVDRRADDRAAAATLTRPEQSRPEQSRASRSRADRGDR